MGNNIERPDLHRKYLLCNPDDDVIGFLRCETSAQNIAHFIEQGHFVRALLEFVHPGCALLVGVLQ